MQRYADFYANLGYSSIQLGLNTAALKGFDQIFSEQGHWNDAERQVYTDIMARDTLNPYLRHFWNVMERHLWKKIHIFGSDDVIHR